ncbi:hypothetical protein [Frankia sp. Cj3]|uniref:hypothetical protein n=1 Tax=Frankia sp. Cj3 TaxID=2880976 RepID=UPI001EF5F7A1|nr:hypothetical protein [Frankia sp. Cj3]
MLTTFFAAVIGAIEKADRERVFELLGNLGEPNETHFGYSKGRSKGRGLGPGAGKSLADALSVSRAVQTGMLKDLEDTALLVPGIDRDIISDIATNVLRGALVGYTQRMAELFEIPVEEQVLGALWNPGSARWQLDHFGFLPRADGQPLLLVPKAIARHRLSYNYREYYRGYLLPELRNDELAANSSLVKVLKGGGRYIPEGDLRAKYPENKAAIVGYTEKHPEALYQYKEKKREAPAPSHHDFAAVTKTSSVDYEELFAAVEAVSPGNAGAALYHRAVMDLLTALFHPALTEVTKEAAINDGRKRVDIRYTNIARGGFFSWVSSHYPAPYIYVECKNYRADPENPEIDQLAGRFSRDRGRIGLLVCRNIADRVTMTKRCGDVAKAGNGFIICLDDDDLRQMTTAAVNGDKVDDSESMGLGVLKSYFDQLVQ